VRSYPRSTVKVTVTVREGQGLLADAPDPCSQTWLKLQYRYLGTYAPDMGALEAWARWGMGSQVDSPRCT
jgi:hypothetical protein